MNELLWVAALTFLPGLELRASIPYGVLVGLPWPIVFLTAVAVNIVVGALAYAFVFVVVKFLRRMKWFDRLWARYVQRLQRKAKPHVDKYGDIGLALFIGVPLPLTGAYSGAAAAEVLGIPFKRFLAPMAVGVLLAGVLVTAISVLGVSFWGLL